MMKKLNGGHWGFTLYSCVPQDNLKHPALCTSSQCCHPLHDGSGRRWRALDCCHRVIGYLCVATATTNQEEEDPAPPSAGKRGDFFFFIMKTRCCETKQFLVTKIDIKCKKCVFCSWWSLWLQVVKLLTRRCWGSWRKQSLGKSGCSAPGPLGPSSRQECLILTKYHFMMLFLKPLCVEVLASLAAEGMEIS